MTARKNQIHAQVHFSKGHDGAYDFCKGLKADKVDGRKTDAFNEGVQWRLDRNATIHEAHPETCGEGSAVNIRYTV